MLKGIKTCSDVIGVSCILRLTLIPGGNAYLRGVFIMLISKHRRDSVFEYELQSGIKDFSRFDPYENSQVKKMRCNFL